MRFRSDGFRIRRGTADPAFLSGPVELLRLDKDLVYRLPCLIFQSLIEAVCSARVTGDAADLLNPIADRVAVLALDPTPPLSGGSLLADRIRMEGEDDLRENVFVRSIPSGKAPGAVSPILWPICSVLSECGWTRIIVETVGTGQSEFRIAALVDRLLLVACQVAKAAQGTGDGLAETGFMCAARRGWHRVAIGMEKPVFTTINQRGNFLLRIVVRFKNPTQPRRITIPMMIRRENRSILKFDADA